MEAPTNSTIIVDGWDASSADLVPLARIVTDAGGSIRSVLTTPACGQLEIRLANGEPQAVRIALEAAGWDVSLR